MPAALLHREARGIDRLLGADGVALDAGNLDETGDRVARHAEVMLPPDQDKSAIAFQ